MKKLIALFLALTLVFSVALALTACGDTGTTECTAHTDADGNGKCDKCDKDMPKTPEDPEDPEDPQDPVIPPEKLGETISAAVIAQLNAASSVKIEMESSTVVSQALSSAGVVVPEASNYMNNVVKLTAVVSKGETGVNAKLDVSMKTNSPEGEAGAANAQVTVEYTALYIVDNEIYVYDTEEEGYTKQTIEDAEIEEVTDMLAAIFEGVDLITDDDIAAIKKAMGDLFVQTFTLDGTKASLVMDAKPTIDAILGYIGDLDFDTKTVEDLINDLLALVDEELTISDLLAELKIVAGLTVNEALAEIDTWLTENYDTTVQGIYDSIFSNEDVLQILKNLMKVQAGLEDAEIDAQIAQLQAIDIAALLETPIGETAVGDTELIILLSTLLASSNDPEDEYGKEDGFEYGAGEISDTSAPDADMLIEQVFGMIEAYLPLTLADLCGETPIASMIQMYVDGVAVNAYNQKINVNFTDGYNVSTIEGESNVDVKIEMPGETSEDVATIEAQMKATFKIYDLSTSTVEIKLPENIKIITDSDVEKYE